MVKDRAMGRKESRGLTVMELIVTLGILGILMAFASPLIAKFTSGYKLRGAAREVATDLQFVRLLAVKENKDFQVLINSDSYHVVRVSDGFVTKSRSFSIDYPGISLSTLSVTFNSRGNSSGGTVTVSNPMGTKNIAVGSTGRVQLQ